MSKKGDARSRKAHFDEDDLSRLILVDGKIIRVRDATNEEFDQYIYDRLGEMYQKTGHVLEHYQSTFDYDWKYQQYRLMALNELCLLNLARRSAHPPKPKIALFVEEEHVHG